MIYTPDCVLQTFDGECDSKANSPNFMKLYIQYHRYPFDVHQFLVKVSQKLMQLFRFLDIFSVSQIWASVVWYHAKFYVSDADSERTLI